MIYKTLGMNIISSCNVWKNEFGDKYNQEELRKFSGIICGDMVEKSKPAPDIFLKACELINTKAEECYALEDSKNGLLSAYHAGCKVIMIPDLCQPDDQIQKLDRYEERRNKQNEWNSKKEYKNRFKCESSSETRPENRKTDRRKSHENSHKFTKSS